MSDNQTQFIAQLKEIVVLLNKIDRTYASERFKTIGQLQDKIWDDPNLQHEEIYFLQEFASDLNFYEPIAKDRDTALGYYDDGRLLELTSASRKQIQSLLANK